MVIVVGPPRSAARQLQVVRAFGRLLPKEDVIDALLASPSPEAVVTLPVFAEYEIPEQLLVRDLMTERRARHGRRVASARRARADSDRLGALPVVDDDSVCSAC